MGVTIISIFCVVVTIAFLWLGVMGSGQGVQNHPLSDEVVNATVSISPPDPAVGFPLPENRAYEVFAQTTGRGMSVTLAYSYVYWSNTSTSDKFGVKWDNHTTTSRDWVISSGIGLVGNLGTTDDNHNVDRIFVIPQNAIAANIGILSTDSDPHNHEVSTVHILVIPSEIPTPPLPESVGSIVKCSNYSNRATTAQHWWSSDGSSWLDAFQASNYSLSITDKYTTYTFPTNLTIINQSADKCRVLP